MLKNAHRYSFTGFIVADGCGDIVLRLHLLADDMMAGRKTSRVMQGEEIVAEWTCEMSPNDPKLSDSGVRRGTCAEGGKAAVEAGAVTCGAVRCSAWLGVSFIWDSSWRRWAESVAEARSWRENLSRLTKRVTDHRADGAR